MNAETILPRRLVVYIHDVGVKALDHLADNVKGAQSDAVQTLVDHWKAMSKNDKEQFVDRVATSVVEVVAASALLPVGLKLGKKAVRKARKAIKRRAKALRKSAKRMARSSGDGKAAKKKKQKKAAA
ncbi:MAG: hypothetical protein DMF57_02865 [Acidobacteria bacterium]|nr:MAG: hypothetical protein DMF57_02865 [Acidobacteriota bacterium]